MYTEEVEDGRNRRSSLEQEEEEEEEKVKNAGEEQEMEEEVENEEEKNEEVYINIVCKCLPTLLSSVETSTVGLFCRTLAPFARLSRVFLKFLLPAPPPRKIVLPRWLLPQSGIVFHWFSDHFPKPTLKRSFYNSNRCY